MPEISVIIPMYHPPKLSFRRCLDSLIEQTYTDFEVIVVEDGFQEGYEHIIDEYEKRDDRIRFFCPNHGGVAAARNYGMKIASGKYISFVDSDDFVDPSFLTEMRQAMNDADVAICAISEQYHPVYPGWTDRRIFFSKPSAYNGIQYINYCHNKLFRADLIRENNLQFPEGVEQGEDALFVASYLDCCQRFRMVREPRYHYVWEESSAMQKYRPSFWNWEQKVMDTQRALFSQYPLSDFERQAMEHWVYTKLNYAFSYYMRREKNFKIKRAKIAEICHTDAFAYLRKVRLRNHRHMNRKERYVLLLWKLFGGCGVWMAEYGKKVYKKLAR